jgi:hypothetical protein
LSPRFTAPRITLCHINFLTAGRGADRDDAKFGVSPPGSAAYASRRKRSAMRIPVHAAARLDRLPIGPFHRRRVLRLVGGGMFFDSA